MYDVNSLGQILSEQIIIGQLDDLINNETDDIITSYLYTDAPSVSTDPPGGLIEQVTDPLGRITQLQYNSRGNVTEITYAVGTANEGGNSRCIVATSLESLAFPVPPLGRLPHHAFRGLVERSRAPAAWNLRRATKWPACLEGSDKFVSSFAASIATWASDHSQAGLPPAETLLLPRRTVAGVLYSNPGQCRRMGFIPFGKIEQ